MMYKSRLFLHKSYQIVNTNIQFEYNLLFHFHWPCFPSVPKLNFNLWIRKQPRDKKDMSNKVY